jgi:CubicO group peptidase (beta-lactamase class C family)
MRAPRSSAVAVATLAALSVAALAALSSRAAHAQAAPSPRAPGNPPLVLAPPAPAPTPQLVLPPPADAAPAPQAAPGDGALAPDLATLQRQIAQILVQEHVPGAAVALANTKQTLLVAGFGLADPATSREVKPGTPFAAGPLSPLFVALTALRAAANEEQVARMDPHHHEGGEAGEHATGPGAGSAHAEATHTENLESPLHAPLDAAKLGLSNPFAPAAPLRLEHLLEQTAGLEDLAPRDLLPAETANPPLASVLGLRDRTLRWAPGSRYAPSRTSFTAAALQLEQWSRSSFAALVEAEVTRPLGLACTSFRPGPELLREQAVGHLLGKAFTARPQLHWPAQGLVTCAADLATLLRLLLERGRSEAGELHGGQLVPPAMIDRMRAGTTLSLPPGLVVSGLGTRAAVLDGTFGVGQSGAAEGSSAELYWFVREGVGYAVLLASESPVALARVAAVTRRYLLSQAPRTIPPGLSPDPLLAQASGVWTQVAPATGLGRSLDELFGFATLTGGADGLSYSFSLGTEQRLVPMGRGALRLEADSVASAGLVVQGERTLLVTPDGTFEKAAAWWVFLRLALLGAALVSLGASLLFALVWVPRALFGKLKGAPDLRMRALPPLAALALGEWLLLWVRGGQPLGALNLTTGLLAALGLIYGALSLAALLEALVPKKVRARPQVSVPGGPAIQVQVEGAGPRRAPAAVPSRAARAVRAFCLTVSLLAVFLAALLASYGLLGVRTWK